MERVLTVEEKIRRAEEIYQKRRQGEARPVAKVAINSEKKDIKLLKKMVIQMLICVAIYLMIYAIQNNQYVFSEDFINKANEILSYDTNFIEIYQNIKNQMMSWINKEEKQEEQQEEQQQTEQENQESIGGAEEMPQNVAIENLSQEEQEIQKIKSTTTFIKPVEGVVSSKYGQRDTATGSVPKNHTGTDIAADMGTKIIAATEGEVVLASEEGDYRKTSKSSNWGSKYYLCTLQSVICKTRR